RKQRIPFVTLLAVRNGAIVDFTVNPGDSKIRLPAVMEKEASEPKVATSNPPSAEATAPTAPKKEPLIIKVGPSPELIEQKKAAEAARLQTNTPAVTTPPPANANPAPAPQAASTNIAAVATNKPPAVPATNVVAPVQP